MIDDPSTLPPPVATERDDRRELREMNEQLLIASVRQHELAEQAQQAEAALRKSQEQLRRNADVFSTFVEHAPFGIYVINSEFRIAQVNDGAQAAFRNVKPLIGRDFGEAMRILWPEPFAGEVIDIFRRTLATGESYIAPSLTERRHDLDVIESYEWQAHRVTLPDGQLGVLCYFFDATRLRRAEVELRESEERFRTLADNISQFAWTADAQGWIYWYNRRWYDYTGTMLEEMQGWGWKKVHHPDHVERVVERIQRSWDTGEPWEDTFPLRGKTGEYRWFLSRARAIRDGDGKVLRWFGTNTDVTEHRELEKQTQQQAATLADLHRRKDEFLAMLSHELRNPLAPIVNAVQLLRLQSNEEPIQKQARLIIERQVGQLSHLVDDLLEVSRISTGRIHLHEERVDLRSIVRRAVETVRPLIGGRGHALSLHLAPQPVWLHADASRLEQVVVNLLTNAAKYTERGGNIWVDLEPESGAAVLRIRDNGVGIAPELLPRIFDLFTQAERSLDRAQGGLGIGLALVHQLVQLHGGRIEVLSTLGQGSEFIVRLPLVAAPAPLAPLPAAEAPRPAGNGCRVLVVDDNLDAASSLTLLLSKSGHEVRMVHDGPAALDAVGEYRPDAVLLDIGLPGLNGYEVARRLREQPSLQHVVLIAMTGYGQETDRQDSHEAGFDHHLVKPASFEQVRQILAAVVEKLA